MSDGQERILVIRHGALGDVVLSTGPFAAIRNHHNTAHITLLTTKPYAALLKDSPYFDAIVVDEKPKPWQFVKLLKLRRFFEEGKFDRVYDLQTSSRSTYYYKLLPQPKPEFSGIAAGASHRHHMPERTSLHTLERQKQQLAITGVTDVPGPDVSWLKGRSYAEWTQEARSGDRASPEPRAERAAHCAGQEAEQGHYILLIPGGSAHRPEKRWPAEYFSELAARLCNQGIQPVLIGTEAEREVLDTIAQGSDALNLCNQTSFGDLAELGRGAMAAIGNDTGPMHLVAATGCPSIVLFNTSASDPSLCAPRGEHIRVLQAGKLESIASKDVIMALKDDALLDTA